MSDSKGGWELTKENIQPLPCGRRMADLEEALPMRIATDLSDQQQYEEHHLKEIEKMEQFAQQNSGDDPLQAWVNLISYFPKHFPNMPHHIKVKYTAALRKVMREFYQDPGCANDERYISILITGTKALPSDQQIKLLLGFLRDGKGATVSSMYIRLAELYNGEGDTKNASHILLKGIEENAQPKCRLQEMLTYVQDCWANNAKRDQDSQSNVRSFASSVPIVGENNEAVSIRVNLQPAAPAHSSKSTLNGRQNAATHKLKVLSEENALSRKEVARDDSVHRLADLKRLETLDSAKSDRENKLEACRWNSKHTQLENPVIPEPPEKFKLYQEDSDKLPTSSSSGQNAHSVNKRALRERKEDPEPSEIEMPSISKQTAHEKAHSSEFKTLPISKEGNPEVLSGRKESDSKGKSFSWKRNYCANSGKDNFFQNIKYKPLPPGRTSTYIMMKCDKYFEEREKEMRRRELENNQVEKLRKEMEVLASKNEDLLNQIEQLKTIKSSTKILEEKLLEQQRTLEQKLLEQQRTFEQKLLEQQHIFEEKLLENGQKIHSLESQNEELLGQLTRMTTNNNVRESHLERLQYEKHELEQELEGSRNLLEAEKLRLNQEIQLYKQQAKSFRQGLNIKQETLQDENASIRYEKQSLNMGKKKSFVDIDVRSRTTEIYSSPSTDQGTEESGCHSGETTVEHQQSVVMSSFMPDLNNDNKSMSIKMEPTHRKPLEGIVSRPLEYDMMNDTPATAPPMDFEMPPPNFTEFKSRKPMVFSIYESFCDSVASKPTKDNYNVPANKRSEVVKSLQNLTENIPVPIVPLQAPTNSRLRMDDHAQFIRSEMSSVPTRNEDHFRRPALPSSDENAIPTFPALQKPRRSILLARPQGDSSDEEEEVILRRHQQTGIDLNVSNLTTMLALGPKPLVNSTPEREKTLRDFPNLNIAPINLAQLDSDEQPVSDSPAIRASRYSMLNEPQLNLSTIQETSRENRSRSTTGSSSGNTMSSTRSGLACSTQLCGNMTARSSSIPRSASRISHQNNNGYHSDTNAMQ